MASPSCFGSAQFLSPTQPSAVPRPRTRSRQHRVTILQTRLDFSLSRDTRSSSNLSQLRHPPPRVFKPVSAGAWGKTATGSQRVQALVFRDSLMTTACRSHCSPIVLYNTSSRRAFRPGLLSKPEEINRRTSVTHPFPPAECDCERLSGSRREM